MARVNYRASHVSSDVTNNYKEVYTTGYYAAQWEAIEKPLLAEVFQRLAAGGDRSLLDLACGQGRITHLAAESFASVVGVDISPTMLEIARSKQSDRAEGGCVPSFVQSDLDSYSAEDKYDVVTAFRFFLNAEDELRRSALSCARSHLKPSGVFVTNIHVATTSPLGMFYGVDGLLRRATLRPLSPVRNSMTLNSFRRLLHSEGFAIQEVHRYSLLPRIGKMTDDLAERRIGAIDRLAASILPLKLLCQCFLVVAAPMDRS